MTVGETQALEASALLEKMGYHELNPLQRQALAEGLLDEPRVVVSAPTASGKTLLALLKMADNYAKTKTKALYIVPLRALAREKLDEFSNALAAFDMKVAVSTGDLDSNSEDLALSDVLVVTSEKMDSLLRHRPAWLGDVGLAIIDEAHVLNDEERGATLEVVATHLKTRGTRLLLLSATINNAKELAGWLGARLIRSNYRPVVLRKGIATKEKILWEEKNEVLEGGEPVAQLVRRGLQANDGKGQVLIFVSTRRNAESLAEALGRIVAPTLTPAEKQKCALLAQKALKALNPPTPQCRELAAALAQGVAFHHAGLVDKDRTLIENGFKQARCLKVIVATTTLAMGIDYPASWVIVRDLKRFNGRFSEFVPRLEVEQMTGRAGRPRYDREGVAVLLTTAAETKAVREKYVLGELEDIYSKLSSEPALRMHSLALIASGNASSFKELFEFYGNTFFASQYGDATRLFEKVERIVGELKEMDFVRERKDQLVATPVGKRVSELYLDPLTAGEFLSFFKQKGDKSLFSYLLAVANATESRPLVGVARGEENALREEMYVVLNDYEAHAMDFDAEAVEKYKTAKLLNAWMNEESEEKMMADYGLPPGVVHGRVRVAEWLAYSMAELAFLLNETTIFRSAKTVRRRLKQGVKEELLQLARFRGIGRVRARKLFNYGIHTEEQFRAKTPDEIKLLLRERPPGQKKL